MEVAPFFVDFHHFLSIFTIFYRFSRFTHFCRDLHFVAIYALFPQFFFGQNSLLRNITRFLHVCCIYTIVFCSECFVFAKYVFSTAECMHMAPCLISKALVLHLVTQSVWSRHSQGQLGPGDTRARSCFSWIRWRPSITYYLRILFKNLQLVCQENWTRWIWTLWVMW